MYTSGPIFVVLVVACLFYLVPRQLSWHIPTQEEVDEQGTGTNTLKTIHSSTPSDELSAPVSTLLMRRAARRTAQRLAVKAEKRRTFVFIALLVVALATIPLALLSVIAGYVPVVGLGMVALWVGFSHFEARRVRRQLDAIVAEAELSDGEETMVVHVEKKEESPFTEHGGVVGPNGDVQMSLWDPITVVPATYLSAPTATRTVRTIDLAAPIKRVPVTDGDPERYDETAIAV
ncbi:MAG: hypothetical protein FWG15_07860 [Propionibacteriaceae bacterium]|nr:hypothetical protein [Propionibacteriaceae bacterium]